jgi:hypothetical protein
MITIIPSWCVVRVQTKGVPSGHASDEGCLLRRRDAIETNVLNKKMRALCFAVLPRFWHVSACSTDQAPALPITAMSAFSPVPADPLWQFTPTSFYIVSEISDVWSDIAAYILEQGGWYVLNVRPEKATLKVECPGGVWSLGFVVKIRVFQTDTGLVAIEWQRRRGCVRKSYDAWLRFRSRFCQPLD